jgi:hypothetical protein
MFNGQHWVFLCFTPDRAEKLQNMIAELIVEGGAGLKVGYTHFPPGVLWNGEECFAVFIRKADVDRETLARGLRQHLGYERPNSDSDVFTLGVKPEDDAALDRVGLFGNKN